MPIARRQGAFPGRETSWALKSAIAASVPVVMPELTRSAGLVLHPIDPIGASGNTGIIGSYLALLGLFPWEYVPTIPCEVLLIGKWFHVNFWDMSNWSRAMLEALEHLKTLTSLPISVQPNAGVPREVGDRKIYLASPDYVAGFVQFENGVGRREFAARLAGACES